jgi:DNA-binding Xre family transcriptional regulator
MSSIIFNVAKDFFMCYLLSMIETRVREMAEARGIKSSYELQHALDVVPTVALRLWRGQVTRFSLDTLDRLCTALSCQPGDLLIHVSDKKVSKSK